MVWCWSMWGGSCRESCRARGREGRRSQACSRVHMCQSLDPQDWQIRCSLEYTLGQEAQAIFTQLSVGREKSRIWTVLQQTGNRAVELKGTYRRYRLVRPSKAPASKHDNSFWNIHLHEGAFYHFNSRLTSSLAWLTEFASVVPVWRSCSALVVYCCCAVLCGTTLDHYWYITIHYRYISIHHRFILPYTTGILQCKSCAQAKNRAWAGQATK